MLNYIWAGLIVTSFVFALGYDIRDLSHDRYRNGKPLPVVLAFPEGYDRAARRVAVEIRVEPRRFAEFYGTAQPPAASYPGYLLQTQEGTQLRFQAGATLPEPLATISKVSHSRDDELQGKLAGFSPPVVGQGRDTLVANSAVVFEPVWFVKLTPVVVQVPVPADATVAEPFAETEVTLTGNGFGLVNVMRRSPVPLG